MQRTAVGAATLRSNCAGHPANVSSAFRTLLTYPSNDLYKTWTKVSSKGCTTSEGQWLEYYSLVYRTDVMSDGTWLSDYNLEHEARLTVVRVDLSDEIETWRRS